MAQDTQGHMQEEKYPCPGVNPIEYLLTKRDKTAKLFLNFLFGSVFISIAILSFSKIVIPPINGLLSLINVGLFEMGITFLFWLKALKLSKTTARVSNLIFIHRIVGEKILFSTIVGLILIVTGIIT